MKHLFRQSDQLSEQEVHSGLSYVIKNGITLQLASKPLAATIGYKTGFATSCTEIQEIAPNQHKLAPIKEG